MRAERFMWILTALTVMVAAGSVAAQPMHPPGTDTEAGSAPMTPDPRTSLNLDPDAQEVLKQTMREHLEALQAIIAALAQKNYKKASAVAHEDLGFPKHHQAMQRERGAVFPQKYQDMAIAHHHAAEALADVIPTRKMQPILQKLDQTIKACLDCHRAYKL